MHSKKILYYSWAIFLTFLFSAEARAGCDNSNIIVSHSTTYGLSFGSDSSAGTGRDSLSVNVPVEIDRQWGCWKQTSQMQLDVSSDASDAHGEVDITPPQADFENIPGASIDTYLAIEGQGAGAVFSLVSFTCAGSSVLAIQGYSGNFSQMKLASSAVQVSDTIMIGMPANFRNSSQMDLLSRMGWQAAAPAYFLHFLEKNLDSSAQQNMDSQIDLLPSIYVGQTLFAPGLTSEASFATRVTQVGGCTPSFKAAMAPYKAATLQDGQYPGFTISHGFWDSSKIIVQW